MSSLLSIDTNLHLPDFTLVSASAGSGKTHTLTQRYLQFLLSDWIPHGKLQNILSIVGYEQLTEANAIQKKVRAYDPHADLVEKKTDQQVIDTLFQNTKTR